MRSSRWIENDYPRHPLVLYAHRVNIAKSEVDLSIRLFAISNSDSTTMLQQVQDLSAEDCGKSVIIMTVSPLADEFRKPIFSMILSRFFGLYRSIEDLSSVLVAFLYHHGIDLSNLEDGDWSYQSIGYQYFRLFIRTLLHFISFKIKRQKLSFSESTIHEDRRKIQEIQGKLLETLDLQIDRMALALDHNRLIADLLPLVAIFVPGQNYTKFNDHLRRIQMLVDEGCPLVLIFRTLDFFHAVARFGRGRFRQLYIFNEQRQLEEYQNHRNALSLFLFNAAGRNQECLLINLLHSQSYRLLHLWLEACENQHTWFVPPESLEIIFQTASKQLKLSTNLLATLVHFHPSLNVNSFIANLGSDAPKNFNRWLPLHGSEGNREKVQILGVLKWPADVLKKQRLCSSLMRVYLLFAANVPLSESILQMADGDEGIAINEWDPMLNELLDRYALLVSGSPAPFELVTVHIAVTQ